MATSTSSQFSISRPTPTSSSKPEPGFSPGASPPLILAFLAIGLFAVSMIGVFGWRRIQYSRMMAAGFQDPTWMEFSVVAGRRDVGPRPKLWDMWTTVGTKGEAHHEREMEWETIMPVAVMAIPASGNRTTADTVGDGASSAARTRPPRASIPVRYYPWTRRPDRSTTTTNSTTATATTNASTPEKAGDSGPHHHDTGRLQVAVAIAMPSRRTTNEYGDEHRRGGDGPGGETDDTLEYTLGVYECDWEHENG
ncbi:hypothetical protein FPV67DRAFT_1106193 [Lyophyllum atratum]|nr:hypothetical protein FPV67DRAFT_1106193 [Lyophyllum atratum]